MLLKDRMSRVRHGVVNTAIVGTAFVSTAFGSGRFKPAIIHLVRTNIPLSTPVYVRWISRWGRRNCVRNIDRSCRRFLLVHGRPPHLQQTVNGRLWQVYLVGDRSDTHAAVV